MVETLKTDYNSLEIAIKALLQGKMIAFPTETVYGIGVLHGNKEGMELMRSIKGRDAGKPFQVLIPESGYASKYALADNVFAKALMQEFWPGAMTLVLPTVDGDTCGLRVPVNKWLCLLMRRLGSAIVASSANLSGYPPALTSQEVDSNLGGDLALLIDGGKAHVGEASTVLGVNDSGEVEIFREGAISVQDVQAVVSRVQV